MIYLTKEEIIMVNHQVLTRTGQKYRIPVKDLHLHSGEEIINPVAGREHSNGIELEHFIECLQTYFALFQRSEEHTSELQSRE